MYLFSSTTPTPACSPSTPVRTTSGTSTKSTPGTAWLRWDADETPAGLFNAHVDILFNHLTVLYVNSWATGAPPSVTWSTEQLDRCGLPSWPERALYLSTVPTPAGEKSFPLLLHSFLSELFLYTRSVKTLSACFVSQIYGARLPARRRDERHPSVPLCGA